MGGVQVRRRLPQIGRIRIGQKGAKGQPQRLETFRFTSPDERALHILSVQHEGSVRPWKDKPGEFELVSEAKELPVLVTLDPVETWYELWSAAGCLRRCDENSCTMPDGKGGMEIRECMCDPDQRECKLKTRVNFLLPDLPTLGTWRLDTGSYFTAAEMPQQIELLQRAASQRQFPEAHLAIETRQLKTRDEHGKPVTRIFPVATLRVRVALRELLGGGGPALAAPYVDPTTGEVLPQLPAGRPPALSAPAAPPLNERMVSAMQGQETTTYAESAGLKPLTLPEVKQRVIATLKLLGYPTPNSPGPFLGRILDRPLSSTKEITDEADWRHIDAELLQAHVNQRACFAQWKQRGNGPKDPRDREKRMEDWNGLLNAEPLYETCGEFTPQEWSDLRTIQQALVNQIQQGLREAGVASEDEP